jgi:4-hydroxybenzoate polyprenyltransferase
MARLSPPTAMEHVGIQQTAPARFAQYVKIARTDHWIKNLFMLPGVALGLGFDSSLTYSEMALIPVALLCTCLASSANYVINEYLDSEFDRFHPLKKNRAGVKYSLDPRLVTIEYLALICASLLMASVIGKMFFFCVIALLIMGLLYNVTPIRLKDRVYLDVVSESINNPLRLMLGWSAVVGSMFPPSSILIAYWTGGAYLMAVKRYSEYRRIADKDIAGKYRRSFSFYTEESLLLSSLFYAICSAFFLGIFLIKYRIEFLLTFPLFALLFTWYLSIGLKDDSAAQAPEKLYSEAKFMIFVAVLCVSVTVLFFVDLPLLYKLTVPISLPSANVFGVQ